ncbi:hypothetical protein FHS15_004085 [Paenibacillus castaneae]|uniref:hypothetical protein n=1 Tax=Paenibacillus castaneae TaxID=474957 RepID=UPI000C9BD9F5|nr:hypothetical protein [Paenibacillus castaneae]NIK78939.1 hypothetical protein [Paenibacillus castaneae]
MNLFSIIVLCLLVAIILSVMLKGIGKRRTLMELLLFSCLLVLTGGFLLLDPNISDKGFFLTIDYGLIFIGLITGLLSFVSNNK